MGGCSRRGGEAILNQPASEVCPGYVLLWGILPFLSLLLWQLDLLLNSCWKDCLHDHGLAA